MIEKTGFSSGRTHRGVIIHSLAGSPEKCYVIDSAGTIHGFYEFSAAERAVDESLASQTGGGRDLFSMTTSVARNP